MCKQKFPLITIGWNGSTYCTVVWKGQKLDEKGFKMLQNQIAYKLLCYRSYPGKILSFAGSQEYNKFQYGMLQRYNAYVFPIL